MGATQRVLNFSWALRHERVKDLHNRVASYVTDSF